ncbi:uncharacterized protein LOC136062282 [Quercus suber]|uniref:uncharacterized protein LOC136062282 n=1 Tax=Quercus suber TaxID=58331 RepID=UPI0032DE466F
MRVVAEPTEVLEDIPLDENNPEKYTRVGASYNQIRMDEVDQEKTSFITSQGLFFYKVIPFGLKNTRATYQRYQPRNAIKAQVLEDFIAEFSPNQGELDEVDEVQRWVVNVDGLSTLYVGGIGVILKSPEGDKLKYVARLQYQTTNNEAEYEALLKVLELAKSLGAESVIVQGDSQLIINQVNGMCEAKEDRM